MCVIVPAGVIEGGQTVSPLPYNGIEPDVEPLTGQDPTKCLSDGVRYTGACQRLLHCTFSFQHRVCMLNHTPALQLYTTVLLVEELMIGVMYHTPGGH